MSFVRLDYNYNQANQWIATLTNSSFYKQTNLPVAEAQVEINKDLHRVCFYPKKDASLTFDAFYHPWKRLKEDFCFIQGDMDGGSFAQLFRLAYATNHGSFDLLDQNSCDTLRFGYMGDDHKRCGVALICYKKDPSKWMICLTQDTDKQSFDERKVSMMIPKSFLSDEDKIDNTQPMAQAKRCFAESLHCARLQRDMKNIFDEKGNINLKQLSKFEHQKTFHVNTYKPANKPSKTYFNWHWLNGELATTTAGIGVGAGIGWIVGAYILGPLLAVPTAGLSLLIAPLVCTFLGMLAGGLVANFSYNSNQPIAAAQSPVVVEMDEGAAAPMACNGAYKKMANRGVKSVLDEKKKIVSRGGEEHPVILDTSSSTAPIHLSYKSKL